VLRLFLVVLFMVLPTTLLHHTAKNESKEESYTISITPPDRYMRECVQLGLELRYQFLAKVCKPRDFWLDDCTRVRKATANLHFDPITGEYQVERDLFHDALLPNRRSFSSLKAAFKFAGHSMEFSKHLLSAGHKRFRISSANVGLKMSYKGLAYCQQSYNKTIDRIAQFFTLGLIRIERYESNWATIDLPSNIKSK
jgi:hypothetical protein